MRIAAGNVRRLYRAEEMNELVGERDKYIKNRYMCIAWAGTAHSL